MPKREAKGGAPTLHLDGGAKPKMKTGPRRVTAAQDALFFATLGETCNVKQSARTAKISPQYCYDRRRRDAGFRRRWEEALGQGYAKLEMMLLERAMLGTEKVTTTKGEDDTSIRTTVVKEYSNALAMSLLKMHRDSVGMASGGTGGARIAMPDEAAVAEARASIEAKLDLLARRAGCALADEGEIDDGTGGE